MGNKEKTSIKDRSIILAVLIAVGLILAVVILPLISPYLLPFFNQTEESVLAADGSELSAPVPGEREAPAPVPEEREAPAPVPEEREAPAPVPEETETSIPPPPIVGTVVINPPPRFGVESWDDDSAKCSPTVTIYGVIVSHGTPPYTFTFWTQKEPYSSLVADIKQVISLENSRDYVEFIPPVVVAKGRYKHVVLVFHWGDGQETTWIDDLFYPSPDSSCN